MIAKIAGNKRVRWWRALGSYRSSEPLRSFFFFLNNRPPPNLSPLPLHAALPIKRGERFFCAGGRGGRREPGEGRRPRCPRLPSPASRGGGFPFENVLPDARRLRRPRDVELP